MAAYGEIDDVIDPADSRRWIATLFDEHTGEWRRARGQEAPQRRRLVAGRWRLQWMHSSDAAIPNIPRTLVDAV